MLRWGIVGAANIAKRIGHAINLTDQQIVAIGSRDAGRGRALADVIAPAAAVYGDYEGVVDDPNVDAVYIPLANHLHREWTVRAARAGKHVLCEKPLAMNLEEIEEMADACSEAGVILSEAVFFHYGQRHRAVKKLVTDGVVGELRHVSFDFSFQLPRSENIRWKREMGGGALYDIGSHALNWILWLFDAEPTRVLATSEEWSGVDLSTAVLLDFPGGATAKAWVSFGAAPSQSMVIVGETGYLDVPRPIGVWQVGQEPPGPKLGCRLVRGAEVEELALPGGDNPYSGMVEAFAEAVRTGQETETSAASAARTMRVIHACQAGAAA